MLDADIVDIALEPDKAIQKVVILNVSPDVRNNKNQIEEKFRLDLDDEHAAIYLMGLIDESVKAVFATVVEQIHKWAQVQFINFITHSSHCIFSIGENERQYLTQHVAIYKTVCIVMLIVRMVFYPHICLRSQ